MVPTFESILLVFKEARLATASETRTELEDGCVIAARQGWAQAGTGRAWLDQAETLVRRYFQEELIPEVLESHGVGAVNWALFASFAVGWLLALQNAGSLDDLESEVTLATLPGFMWLHEERVTGTVV